MATTEKIRRDIEKVREKITEQQKRLRALEAQLAEEERRRYGQRTGWWGVYMSLSSRGRLSWFGAAGEDKVCGAHSRSVKCIALLSS